MVKLHIKRGAESQFLYETTTEIPLSQLVPHLVRLFNGRLKVDRLCQGWLRVEPLVGGWGALIRNFYSGLYRAYASLASQPPLGESGLRDYSYAAKHTVYTMRNICVSTPCFT